MTTPVDIDKLKELVSRASSLPWQMSGSRSRRPITLGRDTSTHSIGPDGDAVAIVFHNDKTGLGFIDGKLIEAAVNALPALIAKAERVDAMTEVVRAVEEVAKGGADTVAFLVELNRIANLARNALSPKESE